MSFPRDALLRWKYSPNHGAIQKDDKQGQGLQGQVFSQYSRSKKESGQTVNHSAHANVVCAIVRSKDPKEKSGQKPAKQKDFQRNFFVGIKQQGHQQESRNRIVQNVFHIRMCVNPRHKKDSLQARNLFWNDSQSMKIVDKEKIRPINQPHDEQSHQSRWNGISQMRFKGWRLLHRPPNVKRYA